MGIFRKDKLYLNRYLKFSKKTLKVNRSMIVDGYNKLIRTRKINIKKLKEHFSENYKVEKGNLLKYNDFIGTCVGNLPPLWVSVSTFDFYADFMKTFDEVKRLKDEIEEIKNEAESFGLFC